MGDNDKKWYDHLLPVTDVENAFKAVREHGPDYIKNSGRATRMYFLDKPEESKTALDKALDAGGKILPSVRDATVAVYTIPLPVSNEGAKDLARHAQRAFCRLCGFEDTSGASKDGEERWDKHVNDSIIGDAYAFYRHANGMPPLRLGDRLGVTKTVSMDEVGKKFEEMQKSRYPSRQMTLAQYHQLCDEMVAHYSAGTGVNVDGAATRQICGVEMKTGHITSIGDFGNFLKKLPTVSLPELHDWHKQVAPNLKPEDVFDQYLLQNAMQQRSGIMLVNEAGIIDFNDERAKNQYVAYFAKQAPVKAAAPASGPAVAPAPAPAPAPAAPSAAAPAAPVVIAPPVITTPDAQSETNSYFVYGGMAVAAVGIAAEAIALPFVGGLLALYGLYNASQGKDTAVVKNDTKDIPIIASVDTNKLGALPIPGMQALAQKTAALKVPAVNGGL